MQTNNTIAVGHPSISGLAVNTVLKRRDRYSHRARANRHDIDDRPFASSVTGVTDFQIYRPILATGISRSRADAELGTLPC